MSQPLQRFYTYLVSTALVICSMQTYAQVDLGPDTTICSSSTFTLNINGPGVQGNEVTLTDDVHSGVVPIGFDFDYFGNTHNQCVIASNNYITFDLAQAGQYSPWAINNGIPDPGLPTNAIMAPYHDVNPSSGGAINYATIGTAPNRIFVASFFEVRMFSCTTLCFTNQIKLFEGSNIVEIHIQEKQLCSSWNSGVAIEGLHGPNGNTAFVVPGRNYPTQWTATNDAYQFVPTGPNNYTINSIPFDFENIITTGSGITINWYDGSGNLVGNGTTLDVSPTQTTTYTGEVVFQCSGTSYTDDIVVNVSNTTVDTTTVEVSCSPGGDGEATATASGDFGPYDYTWTDPSGNTIQSDTDIPGASNVTGLDAGTYSVTIEDSLGCVIDMDVPVNGPPALIVDTSHTDVMCNGESTGSATANVSGGLPPYNISWNDPDNQTTATATDLSAGAYTVTVTDENNCEVTRQIIISEPDPLSLPVSSITDTCEQGVGQAEVNVSGGTPPYSYLWLPDSGNTALYTGLMEGTYSIRVTDDNGCVDSNSVEVGNIPSPIAKYTFRTDPAGILDPVVTFNNQSQNAITYFWDFGDDNMGTSTVENPIYEYDSARTYPVTLVAYGEYDGCADTIIDFVEIKPNYAMYIPSAFTPNSNDLNDSFGPKGEGFDPDSYHMTIYDRWGQIIFQSNDFSHQWEGRSHINNKPAPEGVYLYKIVVQEIIGFEPKYYYGHVTLLRDK